MLCRQLDLLLMLLLVAVGAAVAPALLPRAPRVDVEQRRQELSYRVMHVLSTVDGQVPDDFRPAVEKEGWTFEDGIPGQGLKGICPIEDILLQIRFVICADGGAGLPPVMGGVWQPFRAVHPEETRSR